MLEFSKSKKLLEHRQGNHVKPALKPANGNIRRCDIGLMGRLSIWEFVKWPTKILKVVCKAKLTLTIQYKQVIDNPAYCSCLAQLDSFLGLYSIGMVWENKFPVEIMTCFVVV